MKNLFDQKQGGNNPKPWQSGKYNMTIVLMELVLCYVL